VQSSKGEVWWVQELRMKTTYKLRVEEDLNRVEKSVIKFTYKLRVEFERREKKDEKSALKFVPSFNYLKEEKTLKPIKIHYPSNTKSSFKPKRDMKKETPKSRESFLFVCFVVVLVT
jgi:hypothetical protein